MSNDPLPQTPAAPDGRATDAHANPAAGDIAVRPEGLERRELRDGGELLYVPALFDVASADAFFAELRDEIPWEHVRIRGVPQKLGTYWIGTVPYAYSRQERPAAPWLPAPRAIAAAIEPLVLGDGGEHFEGVLLNHYRDGDVKLGFHADDEPVIVPDSPIASVSLGAPRRFVLRHNATGATHELTLAHGSLLVMLGTTQRFWKHAVPPQRGAGPRINLTFRRCRAASVSAR